MSPLWIIPLAVLIELPFLLLVSSTRRANDQETAENAANLIRKVEEGAAIQTILRNALKALKTNRAAGARPFIAAVLEKLTAGEEIEPGTAAEAIRLTWDDLSRYAPRPEDFNPNVREHAMKKYDFSYLAPFISELEKMEEGD